MGHMKSVLHNVQLGALVSIFMGAMSLAIAEGTAPEKVAQQHEPLVVVQICRPTKRIAFEDLAIDIVEQPPYRTYTPDELSIVPRVIRQVVDSKDPTATKQYIIGYGEVLNRDGIRSASGGTIQLFGNTVQDQPVYAKTGYRLRDYIAIRVSVRDNEYSLEPPVDYWFRVPNSLRFDQYTDWIAPISKDDAAIRNRQRSSTSVKLANEQRMDTYSVTSGAPRIRFRLEIPAKPDPKTDFYPAIVSAILKDYPTPGVGTGRYRFVPKSGDEIPGC